MAKNQCSHLSSLLNTKLLLLIAWGIAILQPHHNYLPQAQAIRQTTIDYQQPSISDAEADSQPGESA